MKPTDASRPDGPGDAATDVAPTPYQLCDGSDRPVVMVRSMPGGEPFPEDGLVLVLNGRCRFWVRGSYGEPSAAMGWPEVRTGVLDADEEWRLTQDLRHWQWPSLRGEYRGSSTNSHVGTTVFSNGKDVITCVAGCDLGPRSSEVQQIGAGTEVARLRLWKAGEPSRLGIRIKLFGKITPQSCTYSIAWGPPALWSLSQPPEAFATLDGRAFSHNIGAHNVVNPGDVQALAEIRDEFQLRRGFRAAPFMPVATGPRPPGTCDFELYMRDLAPFEDDDGTLPITW